MEKKLMTVKETADYLRISISTLRRHHNHHTLNIPYYYYKELGYGRFIRYDIADLDNWLACHRVENKPEETK